MYEFLPEYSVGALLLQSHKNCIVNVKLFGFTDMALAIFYTRDL